MRNWLWFSAALLIPCFWQSRIQSADLSSHIYNAWLASQIHQGAAPGLWISLRSNNVLFDLMLQWLLPRVGPGLTQRLAVSVSVLLFAWGALLFIFRIAGNNWWFAGPCVAMLAYGFIFHMGFFNFYLSMGFCLFYLAIFWSATWRIRAIAAPLLMLAWVAHPFPVVWAAGTAAYIVLANQIQPRRRFLLLLVGLASLVATRFVLTYRYAYSWSSRQIFFITGANLAALFGVKYVLPLAVLLLVWLILLRSLIKQRGLINLILSTPFQLWLLNVAAVFLIPNQLMFPEFARPFGYVTERLSFAGAIMLCAVLAAVPIRQFEKIALAAVTVLFFALVYADNRELNYLEDRIDAVVRELPLARRVVTSLISPSLRSLCIQHDLDRACIGHCFSYANYEPASRQFRIRARPGNGIVLDNLVDVDAVARGTYMVQPGDLPLDFIYLCGDDLKSVCSRPLHAGEYAAEAN